MTSKAFRSIDTIINWCRIFFNRLFLLLNAPILKTICQLLVGGIFFFASLGKISHPLEFADIIRNYRLLPNESVLPAAIILPWIELGLGSFLALGIFARKAATGISVLLLVFILAISINMARGLDFDCGCFSSEQGESSYTPIIWIIRDILILVPASVVIFSVGKGAGIKKGRSSKLKKRDSFDVAAND